MRRQANWCSTSEVFGLFLFAGVASAQLAPIGLSEVGGQWFELQEPAPRGSDFFGQVLAVGDFNGDGVADLAAAAPSGTEPESCPDADCGLVIVRYGSSGGGLPSQPSTILSENSAAALPGDNFGGALAAGDFDHDGFDDLAVGIPVNQPTWRGAVQVFYGAASGLDPADSEFLTELSAGEPQHACDHAFFGSTFAVGDFDGDEFADLAVGAPRGCDAILGGPPIPGGSVFVFHGRASGLLPFLGYRISQSSFGNDPVEAGDGFGGALAAGDFDADGADDLAIGIAGEGGHGAIQIVMGSDFGLIFADNAFWAPGALGELPENGDRLGDALASADFDGDGYDDLAIGTPQEGLPDPGNSIARVGAVDIAYGSPTWFDLSRTDHLTQGGIYGDPAQDGEADNFGSSFGIGDFDGDGFTDLAIGQPFDSWRGFGLGGVTVLMGWAGDLEESTRFRFLASGWEGLPGSASQSLQYCGWAVAGGDFDGDGFADLAMGVPDYANGIELRVGGLVVLYGALFADGFEIGTTDRWSAAAP